MRLSASNRWIARALSAALFVFVFGSGGSGPVDDWPRAAAQVSDETRIHMPFVMRAFDIASLRTVPTAEPSQTWTPAPTAIPTETPTPEPTATPGPFACSIPIDERMYVAPVDIGDTTVVRPGRFDFFTGQPILAAAIDDSRSAIAWPSSDGTIRVTLLDGVGMRAGEDFVFDGQSLHGFAVNPFGSAAVLVRRDRAMTIVGFDLDGGLRFENDIVSSAEGGAVGSKWIDDWTHEGRLVWTGLGYTAYFGHTQKWSDGNHQGDLLWHFDHNGQKISRADEEQPEWNWGCSHSLDVRLAYNASADVICPVCLSDCYPKKAILHTHTTQVSSEPSGDCSGGSDARLGGLVVTDRGFALTYASKVGRASRDIALTTISTDGTVGRPVWLTNTPGVDESSAHLARYGDEHFLAGWKDDSGLVLAVIDHSGAIIDGPTSVEVDIERRDDFISLPNGGVTWGFAGPGGRTLNHVVVPNCIRSE